MINKTRVDKYALRQLIRVLNRKQNIFLGILGIIVSIWGITLLEINMIYIIVVLLGFLFFIFFVFLFDLFIINQEKNSKIFRTLTYYIFEFKDIHFVVSTICNDELYSYTNHEYTEIVKIIENKNYLFIFVSKLDAYILSKHTMSYNNLEALKYKLKVYVEN